MRPPVHIEQLLLPEENCIIYLYLFQKSNGELFWIPIFFFFVVVFSRREEGKYFGCGSLILKQSDPISS